MLEFEVSVLYPSTLKENQWVPVGQEFVSVNWGWIPDTAATHLAEVVFERWNLGSGFESGSFRNALTRSMSAGDLLVIPALEVALVCGPVGWEPVAISGENIADPNTPTTIRGY